MSKFIKIIFFVILNFSLLLSFSTKASEKIKIGLMVPLTGENKELGQSIIKAVRLAVKDINNNSIEIIPKDTASKANKALKSAFELKQMGIKVVIGPVFYESITYLDEIKDITFLSLTNKTLDLPKNVISAGINSTSQFNTIKKFIETNDIKRTIFLTPIQNYEFEVKKGIKESRIKIFKDYDYSTGTYKIN
jgi:ABC-type branched-subunit amino acid transport system substrate-binding protein